MADDLVSQPEALDGVVSEDVNCTLIHIYSTLCQTTQILVNFAGGSS